MPGNKELLLSEYLPVSELVVDRHEVWMPRLEAIDFHVHLSPSLSDDSRDLARTVELMKEHGVTRAVTLTRAQGRELDEELDKYSQFDDFIITFSAIDVTALNERHYDGVF